MNFTFVPHKGAKPEKTELVKSHVMREAQKRRREAKQRRNRIASGEQQLSTIGPNSPLSNQEVSDVQLPSTAATSWPHLQPTTSLAESQTLVQISALGSSFDSPAPSAGPAYSHVPGTRAPTYTDRTWNTNEEYISAPEIDQDLSLWGNWPGVTVPEAHLHAYFDQPISASDPLLDPSGSAYAYLPRLIRQPSAIHPTFAGDTPEATLSPQVLMYQVEEIVTYYITTLHVDRPETTADNLAAFWTQHCTLSPKLLLSCGLFYCAYRDVGRTAAKDHHYYKDRMLTLIHAAFEDPTKAVDDENLAAVISMCMYENLRASNLVVTHLKGLRQMIDMRGGINCLPSGEGQHLTEMALLQDMINAVCSNTPPYMFDIMAPILRDERPSGSEYLHRQSPLRIDNPYKVFCPPQELKASFEVFRNAFHAFDMLCIEALDPERAKREEESMNLRRQAAWERLTACEQEGTDELPITQQDKVAEVVRLAAKIHFRAVALRIEHEDAINKADVARLYKGLRELDASTWKISHYSYLWIILTGGAASTRYADVRTYFASELLRVGLSVICDWRAFRQTLSNFLWLQQFLRHHPGRG